MRKRNAKRKGSRFPKRRDPAYCAWIRTLHCEAQDGAWIDGCRPCAGAIECAHVVSRGAGGADFGNCVPLCRSHHRQQHDFGIKTFQRMYGLYLPDIAAALALAYDPEEPPVW